VTEEMHEKLNGELYKQLISYGIKNLKLYEEVVNDMNVFPVPDGDTGTNMTLTLTNGFEAIKSEEGSLSDLASKFAYAVAFGARGNSGVISSQFFKGFSQHFANKEEADAKMFIEALEQGVQEAYKSVSKPTEGTILTVVREATEQVRALYEEGKIATVHQVIEEFLKMAEISLKNTPNLLPVLRDSGVVDSGGAGLLYFFQGMKKYLANEEIRGLEMEAETVTPSVKQVDYATFDRYSTFKYGYCTEVLLQLTEGKEAFDYEALKAQLEVLGDSVATVYSDDKVKVHVHTKEPEQVLSYCRRFGEFLNIKIENMSVQHSQKEEVKEAHDTQEEQLAHSCWSIVTTASDDRWVEMFQDMGAKAVINGGQSCNPSVSNFLEAFHKVNSDHIIVFPNNKNVILTAEQAKKLYPQSQIHIITSTSMAECYAALGMVDYNRSNPEDVIHTIETTMAGVDIVSISKAVRDTVYDQLKIEIDDYVAIEDNHIVGRDKTLEKAVFPMIDKYLEQDEKDVLTLFVGTGMTDTDIESIIAYVEDHYYYVDCGVVQTDSRVYGLIMLFE
jgi:DAK2 domain fusion protein YloV